MNLNDVRQSTYLTGYVLDYDYNDKGQFVTPILCPVVPAKSSSYIYKYFGQEATDVTISDIKHDKAPPNTVDYDVAEGTGKITTRALMKFVSDEEIKEAPDPIRPLEDAAVFLTRNLMLQQELRMFAVATATSNGAQATQVWDHASATIRANIVAGRLSMLAAIQKFPTHFVQGPDSWEEMLTSTDWVDDAKYQPFYNIWNTTYESAVRGKPLMGMEAVVAGALYNSGTYGSTYSLAYAIGTDAFLIHVDPRARGYTWAIQPKLSNYTVTKQRDEMPGGFWIKVQHQIDFKEVGSSAIYEISVVTD